MHLNNNLINEFPIHVIGTNASGIEEIPKSLQELIFAAKRIAGPKRILKDFHQWWLEQSAEKVIPELFETDKPEKLISWINQKNLPTIVLASGDPLWFGIGRSLLDNFSRERLHFHPAPSSIQLAFARIGRPWQDSTWISLHGRDPSYLADFLKRRPKALAILTDPYTGGATVVREFLRAHDLEQYYSFWICENLGHKEESVERILPNDKISKEISPLHLVILIAEAQPIPEAHHLPLFGISDGIFLQHEDRPGLMTKREVRVQLLADLELPIEGVFWDIGAGVGSVSLEALRLRPMLKLLAIEKRLGGKKLIEQNAKILAVKPTAIYQGEALNLLSGTSFPKELEIPDRVLIGGSGGNRKELIKLVIERIKPSGIIVIPLSTIEALSQIVEIFKSSGFKLKITQNQTFRGVPLSTGTRLSPINPIFIIKGKSPQKGEDN